jgi:hypothetical protein
MKASKFEVPTEMSSGKIEDFHDGLSKRIGLMAEVFFFAKQHIRTSLATIFWEGGASSHALSRQRLR